MRNGRSALLEPSSDGFIEHVSQGWNVGQPPYGYYAEKVPHPVPARRAEGRTKHRLVPDASRAPAVTSLWVREEALCTPVSRFFATHVFGPDRRTHLKAALEAARVADGTGDRTAKERPALEQAIKAIGERQARLIRTLADGGPDPDQEREFRDAIRQEHATLGTQRTELAEQLARLEAPKQAAHPADTAALLDALPYLNVDLARVPEELQRRLYNAFVLEVRYSRPREEVTLRVTIPGHLLDGLVAITRELDPWNKESSACTKVLALDHGTRDGQS